MSKRNTLLRFASELPKTELHLHLDGSLPTQFIAKRAAERDIPCPPERGIRRFIHEKKLKARHKQSNVKKSENWSVFDWCNQFLQTFEEISEATRLICDYASEEHNVSYAEIRSALPYTRTSCYRRATPSKRVRRA